MAKISSSKNWLRSHSAASVDGFGLVEAMIAGVILLFVMASIGRFTQAAMSSGANQETRNKLENRIMNNMQEIQQQDSRLTWEVIEQLGEDQIACSDPPTYTKNKLEIEGTDYFVDTPTEIEREISNSSTSQGIMIVTYSFEAPEHSIGLEKRVLELNPTFAADCLELAGP